MLQELAQQGSPIQQERARTALSFSEEIRGERQRIANFISRRALRLARVVKQRTIYDAQYQKQLPGHPVRGEGDGPTGDPAVDEAYDGSEHTFALFHEVYGRNSIDDQGLHLHSTVHYGQGYDNAFWNGKQMSYGDGDEDLPEEERIFNRFTIALDIIAHELTHGVIQYEAGLIYRDQSGALNESFADVFGTLVKQRTLHQAADEADWLIGANLFTANVNAQGIRSMKAPGTAYNDPRLGKDRQPGHMRDLYRGSDDHGGVHINSGIPNRAFYLAAMEMGGYAWEKAGRIWYITLRDKLDRTSDFQEAAQQTFQVAADLFGVGSLEQQAVRQGWAEVGINIDTSIVKSPPEPRGCLLAPTAIFRSLFVR
ncbi:MAG: M4 family metallopeptidase [Symploca sp. SIO2E6]|nr:M4 family metallopeptidase [Symploca sp. SIO2E6]